MKPEHFIYKSDGLYYMQNVPDKCYYYYRDERTQTEEFDYKSYNEALECAKAEAVKVKDFELEVLVPNHHYPTVENTIYTINMEEKIEVVEEPELPGFDHTSYPTFRKVARIEAPKKEEESEEHLWDLVLSTYGGDFYASIDDAEEKAIISKVKEKFEIKRKPL